MALKIGINGFGRIGRLIFRIALERGNDIELCGINLRNADIEHMVYMIKYDSVFGRFEKEIRAEEDYIIVDNKKIRVFSENDASNIKWEECQAEYIIESTGVYNTKEKAALHMKGGAKKVIITAPAKDDTPTFVMGVNHKTYTTDLNIVSNASCTTNCLAPLVKVINEKYGIEKGLMSTIHAATAKQKAVDSRAGRDWRTGRSVFNNIIPSSTGAAKACADVIPEIKGKMTGMSFRVPTNDVSVVDLTVKLKNKTTYEEICKSIKEASETNMKGIISYISDAVVSSDLKGDSHTCIFDEQAGIMLDDDFVKLIAWYDNEWGYSNKVVDLAEYMYHIDMGNNL